MVWCFPTGAGRVEARKFIARDLKILLTAVGLQGKYSGLHAFRHFYASWCINRQADGGLGLPAKLVQERLGHSSIVMTMDIYGHLFPRTDDGAELATAEKLLLA